MIINGVGYVNTTVTHLSSKIKISILIYVFVCNTVMLVDLLAFLVGSER